MNFIFLSGAPGTFFQRAIGAYQIAHHLRTFGYTCQVIDFVQYYTEDELNKILDLLITSDTLAVGVSTTWLEKNQHKDTLRLYRRFEPGFPDNVRKVLERIKNNSPSVKIIAGGANTKRYNNDPLFDHVLFSYTEDRMLQLANALSGKDKFEKFNIETLQHRFIDQDIILDNESIPIEISRGCIFKCAFCSFPLNGKAKLDYIRDPKLIAEEMQYNYDNFKITNYIFTDDTFNDTTQKLQKLHAEITKLPFKINFVCYLRIDLLYAHKEQIQLLKEMGLKIAAFGIETFHPTAAKAIGKNMPAAKVKKFLDELQNKYWQGDVRIMCHMISGLPGEPLLHTKQSMDWLHSRPFSSFFSSFSFNEVSEDKSLIATNPKKYGYWFDENNKWHSESSTQHLSELFHTKHFVLMVKRKVPYEGFALMGAFKHYGSEKALSLTWKDVTENSEQIYNEKVAFIEQYKKRLYEYIRNC